MNNTADWYSPPMRYVCLECGHERMVREADHSCLCDNCLKMIRVRHIDISTADPTRRPSHIIMQW